MNKFKSILFLALVHAGFLQGESILQFEFRTSYDDVKQLKDEYWDAQKTLREAIAALRKPFIAQEHALAQDRDFTSHRRHGDIAAAITQAALEKLSQDPSFLDRKTDVEDAIYRLESAYSAYVRRAAQFAAWAQERSTAAPAGDQETMARTVRIASQAADDAIQSQNSWREAGSRHVRNLNRVAPELARLLEQKLNALDRDAEVAAAGRGSTFHALKSAFAHGAPEAIRMLKKADALDAETSTSDQEPIVHTAKAVLMEAAPEAAKLLKQKVGASDVEPAQ